MTEQGSSLAIIGGGLAGLAAAVAAAERGLRVELFEAAPQLGGRASSLVDSQTGQRIDHCQHVAMGCCTSFLDFCRRTHIEACFARSNTLHFIGPSGTQHDLAPTRWLPAPFHLLPSLMQLKYLSFRERWGIIRALRRLCASDVEAASCRFLPVSEESLLAKRTRQDAASTRGETIAAWLRGQNQSDRAIEGFWSVVLLSALGETLDRASVAAARKVFRDGILASHGASDLVLPRSPLGEIFHDRLMRWLTDHNVQVHLATPVERIEVGQGRFRAIRLADGTRSEFDSAIVAVPWRNIRSLLSEECLAAIPSLADVDRIEPAAITAVHLWFDRPITTLPHAVLVGRLSQWAFMRPSDSGQQYCQVVISASHRLPKANHDELVSNVRHELEAIWPAARDARLLHGRVITQPWAVFSMTPEVDRFRPPRQTPIVNLTLAGDWTATDWPATMEGAVRSGFQAARARQENR